MFDLDEQIKIWRKNLNALESFETVDIDELENHLREEIERLLLSGLSEQEAFLVAAHRLGHIDSLSEEFSKVNTGILWRKRFFWSGIIILVWMIMNFIVNSVSQIILSIAVFVGMRGYGLNIVGNFSKAILFVLFVLALFFIARYKKINNLFLRMMNNFCGKLIFFIALFIVMFTTYGLRILSTVINARFLSAQEFGQIAKFNSIVSFAWGIFLPVVLLVGIILVRPPKPQKS